MTDTTPEYDVDPEVESLVESTDLPRRLKTEVYETLADRSVTTAEAEEIVEAVVYRYERSRVDPLDPVGTVSAQSIGEPGTQMSVPHDERLIVRRDGRTDITEIGPTVDGILEGRETRSIDDHEVALAPDGLEVLSLRDDETMEWKPVEEVSRHDAPDELLKFTLESGRTIRATKSHSFVTRDDNEVVPVRGEDLEAGDWLPVVGAFDAGDGTTEVDIRDYLPSNEYRFTSTLTDGGATSHPGADDHGGDNGQSVKAGALEEHSVSPLQGTGSLPERFPLDSETGFFLGAWLAAGDRTDDSVSVSTVAPKSRERIRKFADRFGLADTESGVADGDDIRLNATALADFVRSACTANGQKVVPGFAFGATDDFVTALLSGYFSANGTVTRNAVRVSSPSEPLIEGISLLLGRIGVYSTWEETDESRTLRIQKQDTQTFAEQIDLVGPRGDELSEFVADVEPSSVDQIPNFGSTLQAAATAAGLSHEQVSGAHERQCISRARLSRLVDEIEAEADESLPELDALRQAVDSDVVWERIASIESTTPDHEYVYDVSVAGLETFTTAAGTVTHNTMNTFHYAGVAEIDVTQGLPRLIELVDARKEPDTPMMTIHLEEEYAQTREKAHEVVWQIEATKILALGDVSTNVADMRVQIDLNEDTLIERWPRVEDPAVVAEEIAETTQSALGVDTELVAETVVEFGPDQPSYRELLRLVEELREITFKGIDNITRVVVRKEETERGEEFVLYTEGSALGKVLRIDGVDVTRTSTNDIHEIYKNLGVEAARESIINETMDTLEEQGLDDVNVRHLMLVADIMTNRGTIESIGRHGISGSKNSVLARAAFEVTVSHLLSSAIHGEIDDLDGVTENVIVGKPIKLGTGDVDLRMGSFETGDSEESAD